MNESPGDINNEISSIQFYKRFTQSIAFNFCLKHVDYLADLKQLPSEPLASKDILFLSKQANSRCTLFRLLSRHFPIFPDPFYRFCLSDPHQPGTSVIPLYTPPQYSLLDSVLRTAPLPPPSDADKALLTPQQTLMPATLAALENGITEAKDILTAYNYNIELYSTKNHVSRDTLSKALLRTYLLKYWHTLSDTNVHFVIQGRLPLSAFSSESDIISLFADNPSFVYLQKTNISSSSSLDVPASTDYASYLCRQFLRSTEHIIIAALTVLHLYRQTATFQDNTLRWKPNSTSNELCMTLDETLLPYIQSGACLPYMPSTGLDHSALFPRSTWSRQHAEMCTYYNNVRLTHEMENSELDILTLYSTLSNSLNYIHPSELTLVYLHEAISATLHVIQFDSSHALPYRIASSCLMEVDFILRCFTCVRDELLFSKRRFTTLSNWKKKSDPPIPDELPLTEFDQAERHLNWAYALMNSLILVAGLYLPHYELESHEDSLSVILKNLQDFRSKCDELPEDINGILNRILPSSFKEPFKPLSFQDISDASKALNDSWQPSEDDLSGGTYPLRLFFLHHLLDSSHLKSNYRNPKDTNCTPVEAWTHFLWSDAVNKHEAAAALTLRKLRSTFDAQWMSANRSYVRDAGDQLLHLSIILEAIRNSLPSSKDTSTHQPAAAAAAGISQQLDEENTSFTAHIVNSLTFSQLIPHHLLRWFSQALTPPSFYPTLANRLNFLHNTSLSLSDMVRVVNLTLTNSLHIDEQACTKEDLSSFTLGAVKLASLLIDEARTDAGLRADLIDSYIQRPWFICLRQLAYHVYGETAAEVVTHIEAGLSDILNANTPTLGTTPTLHVGQLLTARTHSSFSHIHSLVADDSSTHSSTLSLDIFGHRVLNSSQRLQLHSLLTTPPPDQYSFEDLLTLALLYAGLSVFIQHTPDICITIPDDTLPQIPLFHLPPIPDISASPPQSFDDACECISSITSTLLYHHYLSPDLILKLVSHVSSCIPLVVREHSPRVDSLINAILTRFTELISTHSQYFLPSDIPEDNMSLYRYTHHTSILTACQNALSSISHPLPFLESLLLFHFFAALEQPYVTPPDFSLREKLFQPFFSLVQSAVTTKTAISQTLKEFLEHIAQTLKNSKSLFVRFNGGYLDTKISSLASNTDASHSLLSLRPSQPPVPSILTADVFKPVYYKGHLFLRLLYPSHEDIDSREYALTHHVEYRCLHCRLTFNPSLQLISTIEHCTSSPSSSPPSHSIPRESLTLHIPSITPTDFSNDSTKSDINPDSMSYYLLSNSERRVLRNPIVLGSMTQVPLNFIQRAFLSMISSPSPPPPLTPSASPLYPDNKLKKNPPASLSAAQSPTPQPEIIEDMISATLEELSTAINSMPFPPLTRYVRVPFYLDDSVALRYSPDMPPLLASPFCTSVESSDQEEAFRQLSLSIISSKLLSMLSSLLPLSPSADPHQISSPSTIPPFLRDVTFTATPHIRSYSFPVTSSVSLLGVLMSPVHPSMTISTR